LCRFASFSMWAFCSTCGRNPYNRGSLWLLDFSPATNPNVFSRQDSAPRTRNPVLLGLDGEKPLPRRGRQHLVLVALLERQGNERISDLICVRDTSLGCLNGVEHGDRLPTPTFMLCDSGEPLGVIRKAKPGHQTVLYLLEPSQDV